MKPRVVILKSEPYINNIAQIFYLGGEAYFKDDLLNCNCKLSSFEWIDAEEFKCPSCGCYWEDRLSQLTCPCLDML